MPLAYENVLGNIGTNLLWTSAWTAVNIVGTTFFFSAPCKEDCKIPTYPPIPIVEATAVGSAVLSFSISSLESWFCRKPENSHDEFCIRFLRTVIPTWAVQPAALVLGGHILNLNSSEYPSDAGWNLLNGWLISPFFTLGGLCGVGLAGGLTFGIGYYLYENLSCPCTLPTFSLPSFSWPTLPWGRQSEASDAAPALPAANLDNVPPPYQDDIEEKTVVSRGFLWLSGKNKLEDLENQKAISIPPPAYTNEEEVRVMPNFKQKN